MSAIRVMPVGEHALLCETPDSASAQALYGEVRRRREASQFECLDVVTGETTVLLDGLNQAAMHALAREIPGWELSPGALQGGDTVTLPVVFDGPDLAEVARLWDVTPEALIAEVTGTRLHSAFGGFAPGFAYLTGLDRDTPRLDTPRTSVPAGAVAVAGRYAGVYPRSSPGGWRILGSLAADAPRLWDATRDAPALLTPGTEVRFVEAEAAP